jgi:anti-sigma B factor antagonist
MNESAKYSLLSATPAVTIASLEGYVNFDTADEIYAFIQDSLKVHSSKSLILEVSNIEYVSSAGIGVLMALQEQIQDAGGSIAIVNAQESLVHILGLVGVMEYFLFCETVEDAAKKLSA